MTNERRPIVPGLDGSSAPNASLDWAVMEAAMRAFIIVESMFGNTSAAATAAAGGLSTSFATEVVEVAQAPTGVTDDVQLLVLGGPTHAFGMTRASTRDDAARQGADTDRASGIGIREWLDAWERVSSTAVAATFDTRVRKRGVPGSAARGATAST